MVEKADAWHEAAEMRTVTGMCVVRTSAGTRVEVDALAEGRVELSVGADHGRPGVAVEVDLAGAIGYWSPGWQRARALPPDWEPVEVSSLVSGAPAGALYDAAGRVLFGWAAGESVAELTIRAGVSEERKTFVVELHPRRPLAGELRLLLDTRSAPIAETVGSLSDWMSAQASGAPLPVPAVACQPVYSTWYTFAQDIDAELVTTEAARAAELGCSSVFIDDGWQRHGHGRGYQGCGDWVPDESKFPDLAGTVGQIRAHGSAVALWVAPLLLGGESDAFPDLIRYAPERVEVLNCHILDPRHAPVRNHVAATCLRLIADFGVQLLKIDFLDQAMVYRDQPSSGDVEDIGEAMEQLLRELRRQLEAAGHGDVAFEFRQPYVSPALARHGQILRANDCPGDSVTNRRATLDCRLFAAGTVVHTDPMMWGVRGGAEAVAQQLYAGWFAVPQISMRLADLEPVQERALRHLLQLWREHAGVVLGGQLSTRGPENGHQLASAVHVGLDRSVVVAYAPVVVDLDLDTGATHQVLLLNATQATAITVRTGRSMTSVTVRDASGQATPVPLPARTGVQDLAVPAYGSIALALGERP